MRSKFFFAALFAATLLPFIAIPFLRPEGKAHQPENLLLFLTFLGGTAHVAAGYFFLLDSRGVNILNINWRIFWLPGFFLIMTYGFIFQSNLQLIKSLLMIFYFAWQTWHYHRQNLGIASFFMRNRQLPPLSSSEVLSMQVALIGALFGLIKPYNLGGEIFQPALVENFWRLGLFFQFSAIVLWIFSAWQIRKKEGAAERIFILGLGTFFYISTFIYDDPFSAIASYALGHGLQYMVFMACVGIKRRSGLRGLWVLMGLTFSLGLLLFKMNSGFNFYFQGAIFGIYLGIVMLHFLMDAVIWRLRDMPQKIYIGEIFSFVLNKKN